MIYINISSDFSQFTDIMNDLSNKLIEQQVIASEFDISTFIQFLELDKHIFIDSDSNVYPFAFLSFNDNDYLIYIDDKLKKEPAELFKYLADVNFDISKLTYKTKHDIAAENILYEPHFIINGNIFYKSF